MSKQLTTSYPPTIAHTVGWQLSGWAFWAIAAFFYAYEFVHRVIPSIITVELRDALSANDHQLGIIGAMYFYAYAAFQLPSGVLVDKFGAKRVLVIACAILTLGSFLFSMTTSSSVALLSRFMIGAGSAFAFVGCLKIGAEWLTSSSFPLIVGLTNLFGTLGALSGGTLLSYLIQQIGWRDALMQVSFVGLLITFFLWLFLQDKKTSSSHLSAPTPTLLAGLIIVIKNPQSWLISLYAALLVVPIIALPEMWGVEFLKIAYDLGATQASSITNTIFIGTAIGGPLIGWIAYYAPKKIQFMMLATIGALILLSVFLYWTNLPFANLYVILFGYGLLTANMLLCFTLITNLHPVWAQGAAIGFTNMIIMACGGMAQHSVGWILNKLRIEHQGFYLIQDYSLALSILPVSLFIAICLTHFMKQDLKDS